MNILAIGAHFDDVELGCGGALTKWRNEGHAVTVFVLTNSGYNNEHNKVIRSSEDALKEGTLSAQALGAELIVSSFPTFSLEFSEPLNKVVLATLQKVRPDVILTHWNNDVHHDHRALALATLHCARHHPRILMYTSNWYISPEGYDPRFYVDISQTMDQKIALIELHKSENERTNGKWTEYCRAQGVVFGMKLGVKYAEAFHVVRWLQCGL